MSIFASRIQQTIDVPDDPPHTVTIRKLAGRHVERVRQAQQFASVAAVMKVGGPAEFRKYAPIAADADQVAEARRDPAQLYSSESARSLILEKGITAWSYDDPVTPETIGDLDIERREWLLHAILDLTFPNGAEKKTST
jgi:hypothetical protein